MRTLDPCNRDYLQQGQLTLPKEVRERLGVDKGDEVEFTLDDQGIHLRPRRQGDNPFLVWLDQRPASEKSSSELLDARHAGLDETERALLRAGPGARVVRFDDLDEEPIS